MEWAWTTNGEIPPHPEEAVEGVALGSVTHSLVTYQKSTTVIMYEVGAFEMVIHEDSKFILSWGGDCFTSDSYIRTLTTNKIRTVVNTTDARGFSPNYKLIEAGLEEVNIVFMKDCYTPLPSQYDRWLDVVADNYQRGSVKVAVHGLINGPFLIAMALMELGLSYPEANHKVFEAGGLLYEDQEIFLKTYIRSGIPNRSGKSSKICKIL